VVTLLCDGGERYANTYYSDDWLAAQGLDIMPHLGVLNAFLRTGRWGS
jgi:cysteine synthase A